MQGRLDLAPVRRVAAAGLGIVGAAQLDHLSRVILDRLAAGQVVGVAQADLAARRQAEELLRRVLHEVAALDKELAAERDLAGAGALVLGIVDRLEQFRLALRVVLDHHLQGIEHRHPPLGGLVQVLAHAMLEQRHLDGRVAFGDADAAGEIADRCGRHPAPAQTRECRQSGVVPAGDVAVPDQLGQPALREHRVGQVQGRELVLPGPRGCRQIFDQPVVERAVVLELERAQGVRNVLDRVRLAVGEVVGRIDAPGVAGARMLGVQDAVDHRVAHVDVAGGHVDLGAQYPGTILELAGAHPPEQIQAFVGRPLAMGAVPSGFGQGAAVFADLVGRQVVDIGLARADQVLGPVVKLREIIGGEVEVLAPLEAEPTHIALDRLDELHLLLGRIGVVETQMAAPAELGRDAEVQADRLGMADVQVAVGLGRKAGDHTLDTARLEVAMDHLANEIAAAFLGAGFGFAHARLLSNSVILRRGATLCAPRGSPVCQKIPARPSEPCAQGGGFSSRRQARRDGHATPRRRPPFVWLPPRGRPSPTAPHSSRGFRSVPSGRDRWRTPTRPAP